MKNKSTKDKSAKNGLVEFGLGIVSYVISDAIANGIKKLEKEGKLTKKDGEKMAKDLVSKYQTTGSKYAKELQSQLDDLMKASPLATKEDIEKLNARLDMLSKKTKQVSKKGSRKRRK